MTTTDDRLSHLEAMVAQQQQLLEQQRHELARLRGDGDTTITSSPASSQVSDDVVAADGRSRRTLFKVAATAAAAAAAAPLVSQPAHAANGDNMVLGERNTATVATEINATGNGQFSNSNILTVTDSQSSSSYPAAVGAYAQDDRVTNGVYAYSESRVDNSTRTGHALVARAAIGARSNLHLPSSLGDPRDDTVLHARGELRTSSGDLWYCASGGTPGVWRKLAGVSSSGSIHAISPQRVYDSRFDDGPLESGMDRAVNVINSIDPATGDLVLMDVVPEGTTAVLFNLTMTNTVGAGFLGVAPSTATEVGASTINWTTAGQTAANASLSTVGPGNQLRIFCGGAGSTDFIIDITAYLL